MSVVMNSRGESMSVAMNERGERKHVCQNGNMYKCQDVFCVNCIKKKKSFYDCVDFILLQTAYSSECILNSFQNKTKTNPTKKKKK